MAERLASGDAGAGDGQAAPGRVEHRQCALRFAGSAEGFGHFEANASLAATGAVDGAAGEGLGLLATAKCEQDQRVLLGNEGAERAGDGDLTDGCDRRGIMPRRLVPGADQRGEEGEVGRLAGGFKRGERGGQAIGAKIVGDEQQSLGEGNILRGLGAGEAQREGEIARPNGAFECALGDRRLARILRGEPGEQGRGPALVADRFRTARLNIGAQQVIGRGARARRRNGGGRGGQSKREGEGVTCSGNWGLRRLRERPS